MPELAERGSDAGHNIAGTRTKDTLNCQALIFDAFQYLKS